MRNGKERGKEKRNERSVIEEIEKRGEMERGGGRGRGRNKRNENEISINTF